jgi:cellulose biosynthesis protein BcsQ
MSEEILLRTLPASIVIVDTGADTSTPIVRSVLRQADAVIVPVVCEPWGVDGIQEVFEEIRSVGRADLLASHSVRIVISRREKTRVHDVLENSLREQLGKMVSATVIHKSAAIAVASHRAENLTATHPLRKAANAILRETLQTITKTEAAA